MLSWTRARPKHFSFSAQAIENFFSKAIGPVVKIEIEDNRPCEFKGVTRAYSCIYRVLIAS